MGHQMVFKAWLINKWNTGEGGKLIHQGVTSMAFCELMILTTAYVFLIFCIFVCHYSGVLGGSCAGSRTCAFILALTHCHPRQRGSAEPQPFSCAPRPFALKESSTHLTSNLTFISATHTLRSAFNLGFSPSMGGYLHLTHLNRDAEDSMTLELKDRRPIRIQGDSSGRQN